MLSNYILALIGEMGINISHKFSSNSSVAWLPGNVERDKFVV